MQRDSRIEKKQKIDEFILLLPRFTLSSPTEIAYTLYNIKNNKEEKKKWVEY